MKLPDEPSGFPPTLPDRPVEACPHRDPAGSATEATCRLVATVLGAQVPGLAPAPITPAACQVCCAGPIPDATRVGPVVASLVARAAEAVARDGGVPGCDAGRAEGLRRWAHTYLVAAGPAVAQAHTPPRLVHPCHWLGELVPPAPGDPADQAGPRGDRRWCVHPAHTTTTRDGCLLCRDWTDRSRPPPRPLADLVPAPPRQGPTVQRWAVGVTTAPRARPTLDWTLDSLARAGWTDLRIFEDLPTAVAARHAHLPRTTRSPTLGAWPNFYLGLAELVVRHPEADAYFMVQDDVLFYDRQDLRAYLEAILWPTDPPGLISLYCPSYYTRAGSAWHRFDGPWIGGALAFLFPRDVARRFVADPRVLAHRWSVSGLGLVAIDVATGAWADRVGVPVHFPSPSLAQHIGDVSTLWSTHTIDRWRYADRFLADVEPD